MTPQQFVGMGVRLFAVWLALTALGSIGHYFSALGQPSVKESAEFVLLVPAVYFVAAAVLWLFPMVIAHRLVPKTRFENVLSAAPLDVARVGTALLGLWLLATSMPMLASLFARFIESGTVGAPSYFSSLPAEWRLYFLELAVRILIGVVFVFRSAWVAERILVPTSREEATSEGSASDA